ncbi:MAG: hypothetical protein QOI06_2585 [Nocardioidaceae bacterium]|jgi:hypothetical protein|nr:hypothetical protein [Nocardioidaceae bacterium]
MVFGGDDSGRATEDLVFARLESSRREGDLVWRNQRVTSDARNSEIDFVLGLPGSGFIAVEVKGGQVSVEGDAWMQHNRGGIRKRINPVTQAREGMYSLRDYVESDPRWGSRGHARWAHAVVLPYSEVAADFAMPDLPRHMVFGRDDLLELVPKLANIADRQRRDRVATADDVVLVGEILRGRGHPQADIIGDAAEHEALADYLTAQQRMILDVTKLMTRIEIRGGPGSGKTYLALEQTRRLAMEGNRVALLCYSRGLAAFLTRATRTWARRHRPAYVGTFHGLGTDLWGVSGSPGGDLDSDYWENRLPAQMVERAAEMRTGKRFDAVVVDEAQDFADSWWPAVTAALKHPTKGHLTILSDEGQRVFARFGGVPECQAVLVLEHNLRNTRQIVDAFEPLAPTRMRSLGGEGPAIRFIECPADRAVSTADDAVDGLLDCGWRPQDIALLTTKDRHPEQKARQDLGQTAYWDSFWDDSQVFYGHVLGFKGLERSVVVLAVNESELRERAKERLYVGMSRARDELVVCGDAAYLELVGGRPLVRGLRSGAGRAGP